MLSRCQYYLLSDKFIICTFGGSLSYFYSYSQNECALANMSARTITSLGKFVRHTPIQSKPFRPLINGVSESAFSFMDSLYYKMSYKMTYSAKSFVGRTRFLRSSCVILYLVFICEYFSSQSFISFCVPEVTIELSGRQESDCLVIQKGMRLTNYSKNHTFTQHWQKGSSVKSLKYHTSSKKTK